MESNTQKMKTFAIPKGPITLLMTKNGPIMILKNNNQLFSQKPKVSSETQQTRENIESQAVADNPIIKNTETHEQTNLNKVGIKLNAKTLNAAEKFQNANILNAAASERDKSLRAKRLIDSLQQIETLDAAAKERSKSLNAKRLIDNLQPDKTADDAANERSKSLKAKRLIDSLQQIETAESPSSKFIKKDDGIQWVKKGSFPGNKLNRSLLTVKSEKNTKGKNTSNIISSLVEFRNKNKSYPCHKCGEDFEKIESMMQHFATHRNEKLSTTSAKKIKASPKNSTNKNVEHMHLKYELDCPFCEYKCKESENMEIHLKIHADVIVKPYSCDTCEERFTSNSELMIHMQTHTGDRNFSCSSCGRKFTQKHSLLSHLLTHTGEKPFSCPICEKKFALEANLNRHKARHIEGENDCPICSKSCSTAQVMKKHMKFHNKEEQKYICGLCEMAFQTKNELIKHLSQHTENEPVEVFEESFLCPYCEEIFIQREDLINHFEAVHI